MNKTREAFTLIELLVVVAVMVVMMSLAIPAFNAIRGGTDFTTEVYNVAGTFDQARAYALANNTYVLAGIAEVSAAMNSSASPQVSGTGRIAMAVIASKTGTRPYQSLFPLNLLTWYTTVYSTGITTSNGGGFIPVTKLLVLENLHLVDLQYNGTAALTLPGSGNNMARPSLGNNGYYYDLSSTVTQSKTAFSSQFAWPLGTKLFNGSPQPQYTFLKVVEFDPQGCARVITQNNPTSFPDAIPQYIEIGLQPSHGVIAAGAPASQSGGGAGQIAAIQITGISGATHIYRP